MLRYKSDMTFDKCYTATLYCVSVDCVFVFAKYTSYASYTNYLRAPAESEAIVDYKFAGRYNQLLILSYTYHKQQKIPSTLGSWVHVYLCVCVCVRVCVCDVCLSVFMDQNMRVIL